MCERAAEDHPNTLEFVPDHLKSQEMCNKAVEEEDQCQLCNVPDHFKTQEMCDAAVNEDPYTEVCPLSDIQRGNVHQPGTLFFLTVLKLKRSVILHCVWNHTL